MSNVLSQEEVTALLNAKADGKLADSADKPKYDSNDSPIASYMTCGHIDKLYAEGIADDRRSERYSKKQIRLFTELFEDVVEKVSGDCSEHLKKKCELELVSVDELTTSEYICSMSNPCYVKLFKLPKAADRGIFEMSPHYLKMFGAPDDAKDIDWKPQPPTVEEKRIGEYFGKCLFTRIAEAFNTVSRIKFEYADKYTVTSPLRIDAESVTPNVLLVCIEARMSYGSGLVSLAFPQSYVNFLLLTQNLKKTSDCVRDNFNKNCMCCKLLQDYLRNNFEDLRKIEKEYYYES